MSLPSCIQDCTSAAPAEETRTSQGADVQLLADIKSGYHLEGDRTAGAGQAAATSALISKLRTTTVGVPTRALSRDNTAARHEHGLHRLSRRQQEDHCTRRPRHLGGLRHHPPRCARHPSRVAVWCCRRCLQLAIAVLSPWPSAVRMHRRTLVCCNPVRLRRSAGLSAWPAAVHCLRTHTHNRTHTLFKNMQQTCMNKIQMTIIRRKRKLQHIHKKLQRVKAPVNK